MRATILIGAALVLASGGCQGESKQAAGSANKMAPRVAWIDDEPWPECAGDCAVADRSRTADYIRCEEDSGGATSTMRECLDAEYGRQEAALNATFRRVISKASPARRANLEASQAAWLAGARLRAHDIGNQHGTGSASVLVTDFAIVGLVAQRRADLERFEVGDLRGPARP